MIWYGIGFMFFLLVVVGLVCFLWGLFVGKDVDIRITNKKIRMVKKGLKTK